MLWWAIEWPNVWMVRHEGKNDEICQLSNIYGGRCNVHLRDISRSTWRQLFRYFPAASGSSASVDRRHNYRNIKLGRVHIWSEIPAESRIFLSVNLVWLTRFASAISWNLFSGRNNFFSTSSHSLRLNWIPAGIHPICCLDSPFFHGQLKESLAPSSRCSRWRRESRQQRNFFDVRVKEKLTYLNVNSHSMESWMVRIKSTLTVEWVVRRGFLAG